MDNQHTLWICILFCILSTACQPVEKFPPTPTLLLSPTMTPDMSFIEDQVETEEVIIPTPTDEEFEDAVFAQVNISGSVFVYSRDAGIYYYVDPLTPGLSWPDTVISSIRSGTGPGTARQIAFSNHTDRIAYIGIESHVWVSDHLGFEEIDTGVQLDISKNPLMSLREELIWTPDDQHLIIASEEQSWIYHVQNQQVEEWAYQCDRVALSPKSSQLAIWCEEGEKNGNFAVIEWGGDVWYSEPSPEQVVLQTTVLENKENRKAFSLYSAAGWSADGQKFAYFDPGGDNQLVIVNSQGELEQELDFQGIPWKEVGLRTIDHPVQWSKDAQLLLLYGNEPEDQHCYSKENELLRENDLMDSCWQVVDAETGTVKWLPAFGDNEQEIYLAADQAALSADGRWVALANGISAYNALSIVDLESNEILVTPARVHSFGWGME